MIHRLWYFVITSLYYLFFLIAVTKYPSKKLKERWVYLGTQSEIQSAWWRRPGRESGGVAGYILAVTKQQRCRLVLRQLFYLCLIVHSGSSEPGMVPPKFRLGLPSSVKLLCKCSLPPPRYTQWCGFYVIAVGWHWKLTTANRLDTHFFPWRQVCKVTTKF